MSNWLLLANAVNNCVRCCIVRLLDCWRVLGCCFGIDYRHWKCLPGVPSPRPIHHPMNVSANVKWTPRPNSRHKSITIYSNSNVLGHFLQFVAPGDIVGCLFTSPKKKQKWINVIYLQLYNCTLKSKYIYSICSILYIWMTFETNLDALKG